MDSAHTEATTSNSLPPQKFDQALAQLDPAVQALYAGSLIAAAESPDGSVLASRKKLFQLACGIPNSKGDRSRWEDETELFRARRKLITLGLWEELGRDRIRPVR